MSVSAEMEVLGARDTTDWFCLPPLFLLTDSVFERRSCQTTQQPNASEFEKQVLDSYLQLTILISSELSVVQQKLILEDQVAQKRPQIMWSPWSRHWGDWQVHDPCVERQFSVQGCTTAVQMPSWIGTGETVEQIGIKVFCGMILED